MKDRWSFEYVISKGLGMTILPCGCKHRYAENGKINHGFKFCKEHKKISYWMRKERLWYDICFKMGVGSGPHGRDEV